MRFPSRSATSSAMALVFSGALASCGGGAEDVGTLPAGGGRYPQAAAQGVDPRGLETASATLAANPYTHLLLVERNGVLVMEDYFNGASASSAFDVRSVTKTVMSILVGIAIDRGLIRSVEETIGDYLAPVVPSLTAEKAGITIRQLLTMTSGIPWLELGSEEQDYSAFVSSPDPLLWILNRPLEYPPGEVWNYNTGASHILSAILTEATGTSAREFGQAHLFGPLDAEVGPWLTDSRGYCFGGHGISLRGRTMIKLGRLFLDGGTWQGRLVVSESWVRESTAWHRATGDALPWGSGYGYLWWKGRDGRTGLEFTFAVGYGGQFILVVPERNTTIAAATAWSGVREADTNFLLVLSTIVEAILPSLG
ncbi:MAG: beta-lactamase family protein [Acidobacteria bacterium]|nr:beta-lactamase family protein [Acidobacteriota bacterium]